MKKILILFFMVAAALSVKAQVYVGGTTSLWHNDDADETYYAIAPEIGYNLNNEWIVGAAFGFARRSWDKEDLSLYRRTAFFAPYVRYSFYENKVVRLFVDGTIGLSSTKVKHHDSEGGFELGFKPGIAINLNKRFSLVAKCGFLGYRDDYAYGMDGYGFSLSGEDLAFGVYYTF
ncbi:outer membrane beta-barrel protein [Bacteroides pyogenes]|uniref:outer membrane beta-barrel protein n=1 Tax=Bacteroides pyogenes TaxID=310300 RepID=UPI003B4278DD